ncbi:MAG: L-2-hydroxyglutarate oxidase [Acidimicrobiia bacterium]
MAAGGGASAPGGEVDVAVVGAGLVGLATALRLLERRPGLRVAVVDKEDRVAAHQSSHNSGVLHAGVYYRPGSLKARLCVEGKAALERFAERHDIPVVRCGKLIVAVEASELGRLADLGRRAAGNGVTGVRELGPAEVREREPNVVALRALHVPGTAVVDFERVAHAYAGEVRARGGAIVLGARVDAVDARGAHQVLRGPSVEVVSRFVVSCAGLHADRLARRAVPAADDVRIVPFRGDYYRLVEAQRGLVRGLVYPVPDPALPFLGAHFTRRIDGDVWAGPNAVLALAREGYRRTDVRPADVADMVGFPGFWRLSSRYWRVGLTELWRDVVKAAFVRELRRYVPTIEAAHLRWGPSGVRAQAVAASGAMVDDFSIVESPTALHVRNAPSPGATASLAIGDHLAGLALARVDDL